MLFRCGKESSVLGSKTDQSEVKRYFMSNLNCYITYKIYTSPRIPKAVKELLSVTSSDAHLKCIRHPAKNTHFYLYKDKNKQTNKQRNKLEV